MRRMTSSDNLKIAVFGSGAMSRALAPRWAAAGHDLTVSSRNARTAEELAAALGVPALPWRQAAERCDVVFLGVHWEGVEEALTLAAAAEGTLAGKVVVDCGNPVEIDGFSLLDSGRSLSERVAERTGATVVKAFNLCHADLWADTQGGPPVPVASSDPRGFEVAARLAADLGHEVADVGGLVQSRYLEAAAALVIRLLFGGAPHQTTLALVGT